MPSTGTTVTTLLVVGADTDDTRGSDDDDDRNTHSLWGAAINLTNSTIGAGCIGWGGSLAQSGGLVSLVTIVVFAVLTKRSIDMVIFMASSAVVGVVVSTNHHPTEATTSAISFEAVGRAAYGIGGLAAVVVSKSLFNFGCMVAYLVIIKENAPPVVQNCTFSSSSLTWMMDPVPLTIVVATVLVLPPCLLREISALETFSKLKVVAYAAIASIVTVLYVQCRNLNYDDGMATPPPTNWIDHWLVVKKGLLPNMGTFVLALVCQHTVHLVFLSLPAPQRRHFVSVSTRSVTLSAVIMLAVGVPAYLTFWQDTTSDLFLLYPTTRARTVNAARLFLSIGMVLTYPMPLFSLRDSLVQLLPVKTSRTAETQQSMSETSGLLQGDVDSPPLAVTPWWFQQPTTHPYHDEEQTNAGSPGQMNQDEALPVLIAPLHVLLTILLWAASLFLAVTAPSLGVVLNLVGCVSGSTMAFLLPGLFWVKLVGWTPVAAVMCIVGCFVACVGTYYSLVDAFT